jgi:membrane-bound lytic murein transglycosylase D
MAKATNNKTLMTGALIAAVSLTTAWAVGRDQEPATVVPMDAALAEVAEARIKTTWDLPVTRNENVDTWIDFLAGRNRERTALWMERSGRYTPMIREQLRARGMPEDLIYLAFIESGYLPTAKSHASAVGLWQFIAETGKRYGLQVNTYVDERRDPIKSTTAALDYLQELYDRFGSWYLAAAAYNTGENRVARIMREVTGSERGTDQDFWKIARRLPRETRNYVPLMLAAGHVGKEPGKYGFEDVKFQDPLEFSVVHVPGGVLLGTIARAAGVSEEAVEDLNPQFLRGVTPPEKSAVVRVPKGSDLRFAEAFESVWREDRTKAKTALASARSHRVQRGQTLSHIAKRYGVSVASLTSANPGVRASRLQVGQTIRIPTGKGNSASAQKASVSKRYYSVKRGDNLSRIADRYNLSVTRLKSLNGLRSNTIRPGQRLRVA